MPDSIKTTTIAGLAAEFERHGVEALPKALRIAQHYGELLIQKVREHASGRPGPEVVSGIYLSQIGSVFEVTGSGSAPAFEGANVSRGSGGQFTQMTGSATVLVGTVAPQAMRLELGFVGTDSLGRNYNQPPFPHWGPASDELEPLFEEAMADLADLDYID